MWPFTTDDSSEDPHADFYKQFEQVVADKDAAGQGTTSTATPAQGELFPSRPYNPQAGTKEYLEGVAYNYPTSAARNVIGTVTGMLPQNIGDTASQIGSLARGEYVKAFGEPSYEKPQHPTAWQKMYAPTPESTAADVSTATEFNKSFPPLASKDPQAWSDFYKKLYEDPAGVTSVLAPGLEASALPFKGLRGLSDITMDRPSWQQRSKLDQDVTKGVRSVSDVAAKGLGAAATVADPTQLLLKGASLGKDIGWGGLKGTVSAGTGVDEYAFQKANEVGALDPQTPVGTAGKTGQDMKDTFNAYAKGEGDNAELADRVKRQIDQIYHEDINSWAKDKSSLAGNKVPLNGLIDTINQQIDKIPKSDRVKPGPGSNYNPLHEAFSELDQMRTDLRKRQTLPPGSYDNSVLGMDQYKQGLWDKINRYGDTYAAGALTPVHTELLHVLSGVDPEYASLMSRYQAIQNSVKNMKSSTGSRAAANSSVAKMMKQVNTANGRSVIDTLHERDPSIGYALAGSMLHDALPATAGARNVETLGTLTSAGAAMLAGQPWLAAAIPVQAALQSPRLMGNTAYTAGSLSRSPVGKVTSAAAKYLPPVAGAAARVVSPTEENLQRAYDSIYGQYEQPHAVGGRAERATGGRAGKDPKARAMQLINMADRIKKEQGNETKPLLNLDDTTVAKALAIANRGI